MSIRNNRMIRLTRAIWRYRGQIEAHGAQYQAELATALRTAIEATAGGRAALAAYRLAMGAMVVVIVALVLLGALIATLLWQVEPALALLALLLLVPAVALTLLRLSWGAPIDWLRDNEDPARSVSLQQLPGRLRSLAAESRRIAHVPGRISDELDAIAAELPSEREY